MNVNSVNPQELLQQYLISNVDSSDAPKQGAPKMGGPPPGPPPSGDKADISQTGQLLSEMTSELSEEENSEIKEYLDSILEEIQSGTFNIESLVEDIPDALETFLEEQGVTVEDFLEDFKEDITEMMTAGSNKMQEMKPPPMFSKINGEFGTGENSEIKDFFQSIIDSVKNGNFDASALAEEAPEALQSFLKTENISMEDFLNNFASRIP